MRRPTRLLSAFLAAFLAERERWALWLPVVFGSGIALYFWLPREPWLGFGPVALSLLTLAAVAVKSARLPLALLALAALGFSLAQIRTWAVAAPPLIERLGPVRVVGLLERVEAGDGGTRLVLGELSIEGLAPEATPQRLRLRAGAAAQTLLPGSRLSLRAELLPPPGPAEPGAFDYGRQAFFDGIGGVGFAYGLPTTLAEPLASGWDLWWSRLRHDLSARVRAVLPGDVGGVADALITGERGAIGEATQQAFRDSSLAHLLSISGLHVSLIAGLLFFALRALLALIPPLALRFPIKKWAALATALFLPFYLLLVGAAVPTQRSCFMVLIVLLAVLIDRRALSMRLIAWAAVVVLAIAPESLLSASFQMSFAAVAALIAVYEVWERRRSPAERSLNRRALGYLLGVLATSLVAGLATAPFAIFHFNRLALYGVAANLIAVPLSAFWIMPWILVSYLLFPFGLEEWALVPIGWGIEAVIWTAKTVAAWPAAALPVPAMPLWGFLLVVAGGLWLCLWSRPWRFWGAVPIAVGLASPLLPTPAQLLISGDARVLAIAAPDGRLWLSNGRAGRFSSETWLRRRGQTEVLVWGRDPAALAGTLLCDSLACRYRQGSVVVALVFEPAALAEDCAIADLVVSLVPIRGACAAAQRIDRFDLWRNGAYAVTFEGATAKLLSVGEARGQRPWNPSRIRFESDRDAPEP